MHYNKLEIFTYVDNLNQENISKLNKNVQIIFRNYKENFKNQDLIKFVDYCKVNNKRVYLSNDIKRAKKLGFDGVYIPSFNKRINYVQNYSLPKNFDIIGSAHNVTEINLKLKQKCSEIFLSPIFKVSKSKKFLDINRFNFMTLNKKANFIALGGINEKNYKMIKLLRTNGFASISWAKKNGLRKLRPF